MQYLITYWIDRTIVEEITSQSIIEIAIFINFKTIDEQGYCRNQVISNIVFYFTVIYMFSHPFI